jgi:hypothetical protein
MDVSRAQLSNTGDMVQLVDPEFPWAVDVYMVPGSDRPKIREIRIWARGEEHQPITSTALAQIPVRQIASVAASALAGEGEAQYRMLARPRPKGQRSWPPDHFERVGRVARWARSTGRPGGPAVAVSEFWSVDVRTARRWLSRLK